MKKFSIIKTVFLLLGTVIGAGFASGREVFMFFGTFNLKCAFCILLCGVCFFLVCYMFLNCRERAEFSVFFRSKLGSVFNFLMIFIMIISVSALTAAISTSINVFVSLFSLAVCLFVVFRGIDWLKAVNLVLVPVIVVVLFIVSFSSVFSGETFLSLTKPFVYNAFLYVGMNIFLASEVLVDASENLTKKQKFWSAFLSSLLFVLILFVLTLGFSYGKITKKEEMPILFLAGKMGSVFLRIYVFVLWAGIFTTLISIVYSMNKKLEKTFGFKKGTTVILCLAAFGLSFFGFGNIVNVFYPLEGVAGAVYSLCVFVLVFVCGKKKLAPGKFKINNQNENY